MHTYIWNSCHTVPVLLYYCRALRVFFLSFMNNKIAACLLALLCDEFHIIRLQFYFIKTFTSTRQLVLAKPAAEPAAKPNFSLGG